jgi:hypothetical protein
MIGPPAGTRVWLAAGFTDMRSAKPRRMNRAGSGCQSAQRTPLAGTWLTFVRH